MNTKLLRQQILDLAIRGKLVKQDPNDEPASVLLERIRAEKEQLIQQGKIKKTKAPATTDTPHYQNTPFDIPNSWQWVKLGEIYNHNTGKALNSKDKEGRLMDYITTSNLYWNRFELEVIKQMPFTDKDLERCVVTKGDLLVCEGGDIGRAAIWNYDYDICIQNHIHRLRGKLQLCNLFYYYVFYEYKLINCISSKGTTIQGLSSKEIDTLLIPLPPLAEQKRIVAEIEKWFALIDELDANKQDLQSAVKQVRAKVLDLAIHGKLVSQDPNDESAIDLLRRINPHYTPSDTSHYQNVPKGWEVCRLEDIVDVLDNKRKPIRAEERAKRIDGEKTLYPYYGATGFVGYIDEYLIDGKFILLGEDGAPFLDRYATKAYAVNGKIWVNNHAHILLPKIDFEYLLNYLNAIEYSPYAKGTTRLKLTQGDMSNILVLLPPIEEQKRISKQIANVLSILQAISTEL